VFPCFVRFAGTGIELILGAYPKEATTTFAYNQGAADDWVRNNVLPWIGRVNITTLAVSGGEPLSDTVTQ